MVAVTVKGKGKFLARKRHRFRVCKKAVDTPSRPHLVVSRSNHHMLTQAVDDSVGRTLAVTSTYGAELRNDDGTKTNKARKVGELVAKRILGIGISSMVFDRGGDKYHGRVAAVAEGARAIGLTL